MQCFVRAFIFIFLGILFRTELSYTLIITISYYAVISFIQFNTLLNSKSKLISPTFITWMSEESKMGAIPSLITSFGTRNTFICMSSQTSHIKYKDSKDLANFSL